MKNKKKEIIIIAIILILQSIIYVICGFNKQYIHMDEAYSLGLASYDKVEIQDNEDFYNTWHNKSYYEDYLSVQEDEIGQYKQVYENQKNDVHPPLYYLFLRFAMEFTKGHYSIWSGVILNIIIYIFITIFTYLIVKKLLTGQEKLEEKAAILAFISSITMASLTTVLYIRMYALSALNILITTYLHMKLQDQKHVNFKLLVCIGLSALVGSLTHYYYLFFLAMLFLIFVIRYIKEKSWKQLSGYIITIAIAAIASLAIFPYSINHMFFGYRGQGVLSKLTDVSQFIKNIAGYLSKTNYYIFNNLFLGIIIAFICIIIYKRNKKTLKTIQVSPYTKLIELPTLFYFVIVAVASPWIELRYIMAIESLIFILVIYYLYELLKTIIKEKTCNIIIGIVLIAILISPAIFKIEPESMYSNRKEIVKSLGNELNLPTIFLFNSNHNRFLDDILLFATVDESYIAKDLDCTSDNIRSILDKKDISNGIIVFINAGQNNDEELEVIKNTMNFKTWEWIKRLNACDVYYLH